MEIKLLKYSKDKLEIELDDLTVAELLRNMLWQDKATELAAWRREHPSKNPKLILRTKGKDSKKVLLETITKTHKLNSKIVSAFKKELK